jgi:hypothetical protein
MRTAPFHLGAISALVPVALFFLFSCTSNEKPDNILPSEQMVDIMVDMHLAETAANLKLVGVDSLSPSYGQLYEGIFAKYGTTKSAFDSTLYHYSVRPEEMNVIYDEVLERLSEMDAEAAAKQ